MRLLRIGPAGQERPAAIDREGVVRDVSGVVADYDREFWETDGLGAVRSALSSPDDLPAVDLSRERTGPPVARPGKVVCVGLNYADHAEETGLEVPTEPVLFLKASDTVVGPDDDVLVPRGSTKMDWEVELGVVLGRRASYLTGDDDALAHVAGFAVSHDVSERAFQMERGGLWDKGKSCETFNPLGPWLVTPDELPDLADLGLRTLVDGEVVQDSSTRHMVFDVAYLIRYISQFMPLYPGDLVNTGTPAGTGHGLRPPRYLRGGEVVELSVSGLGQQRQRIIAPA
jgi:2-keto-4-pentenoate hydratase/2-oxohepta-3-ene-1,7-dioic acid hydratase in catechol pathway